jgi:hypothetical protein
VHTVNIDFAFVVGALRLAVDVRDLEIPAESERRL